MNKLIIAAVAMFTAVTYAIPKYQVYDFTMTVKTSKAKGITTTNCGTDYVYRDSNASQVIRGIIGGCGCDALKADGSSTSPIVLFWNETTKT